MINNNTQKKIMNFILAGLVVIGTFVFVSTCFDFYYDLNDDMVIKDILSGAYSGTPSGYTNQMLYPLGWLLSGIYMLMPKVPVFGIFLCICFGISFFMITYRMQNFFQKKLVKITVTILMILVFSALMLWELVYVQYSVVCGVLAGTACFWFYTSAIECDKSEFWKNNIPAILLVWLAFLIRSEMLLLTTPFIAVVGIWHWADSVKEKRKNSVEIGKVKVTKYIFSKENIWKYIAFVTVMFLGMVILLGADSFAYKSQDWQGYRDFFDARTQVYDYTWYPNYEEQQQFYEDKGISRGQYTLVENYNFGLDETIDTNLLETIASYGERAKNIGSMAYRIKNAVFQVGNRMVLPQYGPYNYFVLVAYGLVIGLAILQKNKAYGYKLFLLLVMRMVPWMYLALAERVVDRIAHPLYMIEFFLLLALLIKQLYDRPLWNEEEYYRIICAAVLAIVSAVSLPVVIGRVGLEQQRREEILINQLALDDYAKGNRENYYYIDVYSAVSFIEKMYDKVDNSQKNYDLLGGWVCHSPLQKEAVEAYVAEGIAASKVAQEIEMKSMADNLLLNNFYFVIAKNRDAAFLEALYKEKGINITLELEDTVGEGDNPFLVYKIEKQTKPIKVTKKR